MRRARLGARSAFAGIEISQNAAAKLIRSILEKPATVVFEIEGAGAVRVFNAVGQGVRFDPISGKFIGFLEVTLEKATRR